MMLFKELWGREHSVVVSFDSIIREHLVPKGSAKALYNKEIYETQYIHSTFMANYYYTFNTFIC